MTINISMIMSIIVTLTISISKGFLLSLGQLVSLTNAPVRNKVLHSTHNVNVNVLLILILIVIVIH